jgi:hypothetical protein
VSAVINQLIEALRHMCSTCTAREDYDSQLVAKAMAAGMAALREGDELLLLLLLKSEIDHAVINNLRLNPPIGKTQGALAVRVDDLESIIARVWPEAP